MSLFFQIVATSFWEICPMNSIRPLRRYVFAAMLAFCAGGVVAAETPQFLNSGKVWPPELPFSEAVRVGNTLYLSGQLGTTPGTLKLVPGGIQAEARQVMENIKASLEAHGYQMRDIVKCTAMLADMGEWGAFNQVYKTYFQGHYPARSAFGANGLGLGARVELECMAVLENR
jgi:2-iminobutanoate/2-iminopropanoate deaminase